MKRTHHDRLAAELLTEDGLTFARRKLLALLRRVADRGATGPGLCITSLCAVAAMLSANGGSSGVDHDVRRRDRLILERLLLTGTWRRLKTLDFGWRAALATIAGLYPHFGEPLGYLRDMAALAERGDRVLVADPILLDGPPGTGKSTLAEQLPALFAGGYQRLAMSMAQSSGGLGGSETFWYNTQVGAVFKALVDGECANPLFLLDEIDKVSGRHGYDPLGPLFQLLEPAQACRWVDVSMPSLTLDASRILWVATSNERRLIPGPLLQRFMVFEIPLPTADQRHAIIASVDAALKRDDPRLAGLEIGDSAVAMLVGLAPREIRQRLRQAYGRAAYDGRNRVHAGDLDLRHTGAPRIGFC